MELPVHGAHGVDMNLSSEDVLANEVGLGPERARRIVESRPFRSWDDIARIEGFTAAVVDELKRQGARLGDPEHADVQPLSEQHQRTLRSDKTAGPDYGEGGPTDAQRRRQAP